MCVTILLKCFVISVFDLFWKVKEVSFDVKTQGFAKDKKKLRQDIYFYRKTKEMFHYKDYKIFSFGICVEKEKPKC